MSTISKSNKSRLIGKTLFSGAITVALYAAAFTNSEWLMGIFTRGGYYAAFPIATVFAFSFAHGSFSSNLWSALGIEAIQTQRQPRMEKATKRPTQKQRPRMRLSV